MSITAQVRSGSRGPNRKQQWQRLLSPLAILVLWQVSSWSGLLKPTTLSAPSTCLEAAARLIASGALIEGLAVSTARVTAGFLIALVIGTVAAVAAGSTRTGELAVDPPMQMLKTLPFVGLSPLLILWFGIGEVPKIALVTIGAMTPIYINLLAGIRMVDATVVDAGRALGLDRALQMRLIILPLALPSLLVGIRYGLSVAWLSLVVAEQINASSGLGFLIANARDFLQTDVIIVCLLVYAILGYATDALVRALEARVNRFRSDQA